MKYQIPMKLFHAALILLIITACNRKSDKGYNKIILGYYCGECAENCAIVLKIDKGRIFADTTDSYFSNQGEYNYFKNNQGVEVDNYSFARLVEAMNYLPGNLKKYPDVIGCPDCFDQCGIFISYKGKEIRLDPFSPTDDFREFSTAFLRIIHNQIQ